MNQEDRMRHCTELMNNLKDNTVAIFDFMGDRLVKVNRDGLVFIYGQYMYNRPYNQHLDDLKFFAIYNPVNEMFYYQEYDYSQLGLGMRLSAFIWSILDAAASRLRQMINSEPLPMNLSDSDQQRYNDCLLQMRSGDSEKKTLLRAAHGDFDWHPYKADIDTSYIEYSEIIEAMTDFDTVVSKVVKRYVEKEVFIINCHIEYENYMQSLIQRFKSHLPDNVRYMSEIIKALQPVEAKSFYAVIGSDANNASCRIDKEYLMFKHDMEIPTYFMPARERESIDAVLNGKHSYIWPQDILEIMYRGKTLYKKSL